MTRIMAIDPGMSTGIAIGEYFGDYHLVVTERYQIPDGIQGVKEFYEGTFQAEEAKAPIDRVICEKFTPRPNQGNGGLTLKSVEPLRIEGALIGWGLITPEPHLAWRAPAKQYFAGGSDLSSRKKAARAFLKAHDLHLTGSEVGQPDADDAISATLHLFGYMVDTMHLPTLKHYFKKEY